LLEIIVRKNGSLYDRFFCAIHPSHQIILGNAPVLVGARAFHHVEESAAVKAPCAGDLPGEYPNAGSCIVRPIQTSPTLYLNWTTGDKLKCNTQYQVDVRVSKDGGATWCVANGETTCSLSPTVWGKVCSVNITTSTYCPVSAQGGASNLSSEDGQYEQSVLLYPNPNRGDQLFLSLSKVEAGVHTVSIDIYDLTGKRVMAQIVPALDGRLNTSIDLNGGLSSGMYLVNVTAGGKVYTERLVIGH
jgi:hypothetical protein